MTPGRCIGLTVVGVSRNGTVLMKLIVGATGHGLQNQSGPGMQDQIIGAGGMDLPEIGRLIRKGQVPVDGHRLHGERQEKNVNLMLEVLRTVAIGLRAHFTLDMNEVPEYLQVTGHRRGGLCQWDYLRNKAKVLGYAMGVLSNMAVKRRDQERCRPCLLQHLQPVNGTSPQATSLQDNRLWQVGQVEPA